MPGHCRSTSQPCAYFRVLVSARAVSFNPSTMSMFQSAHVYMGNVSQLLSQPVNPVHVSECSCLQRQRQSTHQPVNHVYVSECSCMQGQCQSPRQSTSQLCACFRVLVSTRAVSVNPTVNQSTMQCFRVLVSTRAVSVNHTMFQSARVYTGSVSQPVNHAMFQSARVYTGSVRADRTVTASVCPDPATPASGARTASWSGSCADGAGCCATCTPSAWSMRQAP